MRISKAALDPENCRRRFLLFPSARAAFRAFLAGAEFRSDESVALPAYLGWSAREGSGVFDPVMSLGLRFAFYRVDSSLNIDLEDLSRLLARVRVRVLVLIHYFGRVDPHAAEAAELGRTRGAIVVEDSAHAMLTDLVGGVAGRLGDASIFSLHKLLPVETGGLLVMRGGRASPVPTATLRPDDVDVLPWSFDVRAIAERRLENARRLETLVSELDGNVVPLWTTWPEGCVPQSYPVIIKHADRDRLYERLNSRGFGVVSLYHSLVNPIDRGAYPDSYRVSRRIMNLPVHQDVDSDQLRALVDELANAAAPSA